MTWKVYLINCPFCTTIRSSLRDKPRLHSDLTMIGATGDNSTSYTSFYNKISSLLSFCQLKQSAKTLQSDCKDGEDRFARSVVRFVSAVITWIIINTPLALGNAAYIQCKMRKLRSWPRNNKNNLHTSTENEITEAQVRKSERENDEM